MTALSTLLPPDDLLIAVSGHAQRDIWAYSRSAAVDTVLDLLKQAGIHSVHGKILDFGCGCGRILAGWEGRLNGAILHGVDINSELVAFCQSAIPFARTVVCTGRPPLNFPGASFDLVYAASVFTHMTREGALQWAAEMARIVKPGGTLFLSFHGRFYESKLAELSSEGLDELRRLGFYMHRFGDADEGSNFCAAFMTAAAARTLFYEFDLLLHVLGDKGTSFGANQDIAIFRKQ